MLKEKKTSLAFTENLINIVILQNMIIGYDRIIKDFLKMFWKTSYCNSIKYT